ncbi:TRAP transporter substrate-binding protein [Oceanobacter sp. 5_MG-2023]|jgi:C4-dicarboxylate-binding protein DctP|uniref:TRAP transporter substrate-binding protein n=1 Tax=Oceanobacter sp. 5_MG-2023 TaxID=3062645 RepID=UPI0026E31D5D|nr:TRAP transporter substrate-binding protein [Oceanobacter sp. 5_MG-2023]MDO6683309.1 TRAP transporter substrate-binding protein [Oceanobacter sp. 5_MG-2023]
MKTLVATILACASLVTFNQAAAAPIEIKFSHVVAENTPKGQMALKFKELAESALPGQVEVKVYPNSQLFTDSSVLQAMQLGDVEIAAPALSKFQKYTDQLQIFDLPFLFKDINAVDRFQKGPEGQKLLKSMENKLLVGLGYLHNGMKQLTDSNPIRVPADIAGQKYRIMTSDVLQAQFEAVQAIPLKKPFSEVFTLLQTKAIDGQENTWSNTYSKKFFEVQKYATETNHGLLDYMVVTSAEFWYGLSDDVRAKLKAAMDESIAYGNTIALQKDAEDRQKIIDSGKTTVLTLTDAERQQWVDAMKPVWNMFADEIGPDLIGAALEANNQ